MSNPKKIKVNEYVNSFLKDLEKDRHLDYTSILKDMDIVINVDLIQSINSRLVKQIKESKVKIFEIRTSTKDREYRLLGTIKADTFYIVHIFVKKEQKTKRKDIEITIKRLEKENLI